MRQQMQLHFCRLVLAITALCGIAMNPSDGWAQAPANQRALSVVATIKPVHALAAAVLGNVATPELLIDGNSSPHTYALKPSQVRHLNEAHAVIMVSSDLEVFMERIASTLPTAVKIIKLDQTPSILRLPVRRGGLFEDHDHNGHDYGADKGASGHRGHDHGGHGHGTRSSKGKSTVPAGSMDSHIWLDPENAKLIVAHLANVFTQMRPEHEATFMSNARAMSARLDNIQQQLVAALHPVAGRPFIVFHDAYQYFEHRFGMQAIGSITLNPDVQPGAKRIKELRARIAGRGAVCVFAEPQFEPKVIDTVIEGTKVRRGTLDPIGVSLRPGADAYEGVLRDLAAEMRACLRATS